jgi:hypothetical protein
MRFFTASSERMRIDSSGNLLVGTTQTPSEIITGSTYEGLAYQSGDYFVVARSSAPPISANRLTSDGDIMQFRKDGTTVGSIGTASGDLTISGPSNHAGIRTFSSSIVPMYNGSIADDTTNLGDAGTRWKDLYLSGGVYLGGTGSANKLDDYEEGTWTPTFNFGTGITYGSQSGKYIKIGRMVYIEFYLNVTANTNTDTSFMHLSSLPFTPDANDTLVTTLNTPECTLLKRSDADSRPSSGGRIVNSADINFCGQGSTYIKYDDCFGSGEFMGAATYYASS